MSIKPLAEQYYTFHTGERPRSAARILRLDAACAHACTLTQMDCFVHPTCQEVSMQLFAEFHLKGLR